MVVSSSWSSSPSVVLIQSLNDSADAKPPISIALTLIRKWPNALSPSRNCSFPSNHCSCVRTFNCCATSSSSVVLDESPSSLIFIKGMSRSTTESQLKKVFSEFGEVTRVEIVRDKESEQSLGYGFIWFSSRGSADLAVKEMNGKFFHGRFILVSEAKPGLPQRLESSKPYRF